MSGQIQKYTKRAMFIFGFNFLVGFSFLFALPSSFAAVGNYFILILVAGSLISFMVGLSFSRLTLKFGGFGGSYIYVRRAFGNFTGYIAGWYQYIQGPFVCVTTVSAIAWAFKSWTGFSTSGNFYDNYQFWIIAFAILSVIIIIVILYFGLAPTTYSLWFLWALKWGVIIFSLVLCFSRMFWSNSGDGGFFSNIFNNGYTPKNLNMGQAVDSLITFFFAYGGFEGIAAVANDVENPHKNMPKILLGIIIFTTIFYVFAFLLFLGALGAQNGLASGSDVNPINMIFKNLFQTKLNWGVVAMLLGLLAVVGQIANKLTSRIQNGWVNTRLIAPLAADGFLPIRFAKRNRYHQFKNALFLDSIISIVLVLIYFSIFLSVPFFKSGAGMDVLSGSLDLYSLVVFVQYGLTMFAAWKLASPKVGFLTVKKWERYMYFFGGIFLFFLLGYYLVNNVTNAIVQHTMQNIYQIILFVIAGIVGLSLYPIGDWLNWRKQAHKVHDPDLEEADISYEHWKKTRDRNYNLEDIIDRISDDTKENHLKNIKKAVINTIENPKPNDIKPQNIQKADLVIDIEQSKQENKIKAKFNQIKKKFISFFKHKKE
ncbi:APC family permease [Mycoplasma sp. SG1]|uniref:APC family permease n=1 Tax=Mycoplasma sp. SG1 TaxID=2810348 RepID=UPI0020254619|nr:APC family permease [Mycoplasma sp. SG1]URM52757.1 APC family permease [Mycoplasma sp. SG1]